METPHEKLERLKDELARLINDYNDLGMEIACLENEIEEAEKEIE